MTDTELLYLAKEASHRAHAPYSKISVGAALLAKGGRVYLGANIENAAFSPSLCAERVAFSAAIMAGEREFESIAVFARGEDGPLAAFPPCGVCRQALAEFCDDGFTVILDGGKKFTLGELFPARFDKSRLADTEG